MGKLDPVVAKLKLQTYPEGLDDAAIKALVRVRIPMVKEE